MAHTDLRYATSMLAHSLVPLALALLVGVVCAYAALAIVKLIEWIHVTSFGASVTQLNAGTLGGGTWRAVLTPILGGIVVGLVLKWWVANQRYHGPADVMQAVRTGDGRLDLRSGIGSALASAIAIGSGAPLGRYGPSVHLGATLASLLARAGRRVRAERLTLIGCGVAAAISASFSAPLAGVLFAHEVVLDTFARRGFVAITVASVTGHAVARSHNASFNLASLEGYRIAFTHEYLLFAVVGLVGGALAIMFLRGLHLSLELGQRIALPIWLKPAIAGTAIGVVGLALPQVLGLGDAAIHDTLAQQFPLPLLLALIGAKIILVWWSRAMSVPGGVFGPALFLGAMLGSALGQALGHIDASWVSSVPAYTLAGMGAVVSCVIGAPLATILIVFEITQSYALTTAVMVAVVAASTVTGRFYPFSWFSLQLLARGVDLRVGREVRIMRSRQVSELISSDFHTVPCTDTVTCVRQRMLDLQIAEVLVIAQNQRLRGQVSLLQLEAALDAQRANEPIERLATLPTVVLESTQDLDQAMGAMQSFVGVRAPVINDRDSMQLAGVIYPSRIIGAYNDAVAQARREQLGED